MRVFVICLVLAVSACATRPAGSLDQDLRDLSTLLIGDYSSAADGGVREGRPIYMRIREIEPPKGHTIALYAEMRHDGASGELYRQRVYLFDEARERTTNVMRALAFQDTAAATRLMDDPTLLAKGALATNEPLGPGCHVNWSRERDGFRGYVDPKLCLITGRRGDQRRIESKMRITPAAMEQLERGYDLQGKLLFGNPTDAMYVWPRVQP